MWKYKHKILKVAVYIYVDKELINGRAALLTLVNRQQGLWSNGTLKEAASGLFAVKQQAVLVGIAIEQYYNM